VPPKIGLSRTERLRDALAISIKEMDLLAHLGYNDRQDRELKLQWLDLQAHQIVKRGWRQVCDVAQALLERQTLSGDETARCRAREASTLNSALRAKAMTLMGLGRLPVTSSRRGCGRKEESTMTENTTMRDLPVLPRVARCRRTKAWRVSAAYVT
jgi:hypothetical protein